MNTNGSFHVQLEHGLWQISRNGILFARCQNKVQAVKSARRLAAKHGAIVVVHAIALDSDYLFDRLSA